MRDPTPSLFDRPAEPRRIDAPETDKPAPAAPKDEGSALTSPMVGTFYRKPGPDSPAFANVGDVVSEGQTLCIIEAMKVMNEIKAEKAGVIKKICVENADSVEYGQVLFKIESA